MENRIKLSAELRQRAESVLLEETLKNITTLSPEEIQKTFHELLVHQIELEMQNEELRRAQTKLDVAQAHHFDFYNLAPVGYCTISEKGLIMEANFPAASFLSLARDELINQPLTNFVHQQDQDLYYLFRKKILGFDTPQSCELRVVRKDGTVLWVLLHAIAAQDVDGAPVCRIVLSDITDRKRVEDSLIENELRAVEEKERLSCLLNSISDEVWFADIHGQFTLANPSAAREFNLSSSDSIDVVNLAESLEVFRPDGSPRPVEEAPPLRALTGELIRGEDEIVRTPSTGDLRYRHVSSAPVHGTQGAIIGSISVVRDITKHKQAEKVLRENEVRQREQEVLRISEARFREVLEHSLDASYKRNLQTEAYEYLSPAWEQLSGYTPEEMITLPIETVLDFIHPDDVAEVERTLVDSMADVIEKPYHLEYRFKHKDGQYRWFQNRFTVLRDEVGQPMAHIGSISDITKLKFNEEKFRDTMREQKTILDTANVGISMIVDRKQVWVNRKTVDLFQYSKEEMEGQATRILYPTQEVYEQLGRDAYSALALGHKYETEQILIRRDGTPIWVNCNGRAVEPKDLSQGVIWILEDITERKRVEAALRESQSFNLSILNSLSAQVAVLDSIGVITAVNESWRCFALENSLEPGQMPMHTGLGANYLTICQSAQDAGREACQGIQSVLVGEATHCSIEYPCHSPKAERWFTMDVTALGKGERQGAVVMHTDITQRKQAENLILESKENYRRVFENQMMAVCVFDVETLQIIDVNSTHVRLYGYSREELLGAMTLPELSGEPETSRETVRLVKDQTSFHLPLRYHKKKDGTIFPTEIVGETYIRDGRLVMYGMIQDISQRKQIEEELQAIHNELEQKVLERTADLEKTNATLVMMLDYARRTETDIQERVVANLRSNILGIVDVLKKQQLEKSTQDLVELLETTTLNLAHPIAKNLESQLLKLSVREIQMANFIRLGKSTKELATLLNVSQKTVESHRNNLRKKLGLSNKKINLRTFLNSEFIK